MADTQRIFSDSDLAQLCQIGASTEDCPPGTIRTRHGNIESYTDDPDAIVTMPLRLDTAATLVYLGLTQESATYYYNLYQMADAWNSLSAFTMQCLKDHEQNEGLRADGDHEDEVWRKNLRQLGVGEELIDGIMTPGFDSLRYSMSALGWVIDSMELRYEHLLSLKEASQRRDKHRRNSEQR